MVDSIRVRWVNDTKKRAHVSVCWKEKGGGRRIEGESGATNGVYEGRRTVCVGGGAPRRSTGHRHLHCPGQRHRYVDVAKLHEIACFVAGQHDEGSGVVPGKRWRE